MSLYDTTQPNSLAPSAAEVAPAQNAPMTSSEANQVLNTYGIDSSQVLSANNIANTIQKPAPAPDDLLGIRSQLNTDLGLTDATTKLNEIKANYYKAPSVIQGQRLNMGVLRGETGLAQERLLAEIQAQQDTVNSLTAERDYRLGIAEENINFTKQLKLQYAGAGIKYGDSIDTIEKKITTYTEDQKKEKEKDAFKEALRKLGLSTKGSYKDLEKRLTKASKEAAKTAKENAAIETKQKTANLQKTQAEIAKMKAETASGGSNSIASLFGDTTKNYGTSNSGTLIPGNNPSKDALGAFGY